MNYQENIVSTLPTKQHLLKQEESGKLHKIGYIFKLKPDGLMYFTAASLINELYWDLEDLLVGVS